jgi:outer membrane protein OmpU
MKRILYGTTAMVVAGLTAGDASAASGLKLGITGFFRNAIGASWGNGPQATFPAVAPAVGFSTAGLNSFGRQDVSMRQEIRVNFTGETTLDNGITVGVLVGLNGENVMKSGNTTQINRAYADFSGRFGMVRIGETDSALGTDCVADPGNVTSNFGVNSPNESFSNVGYGVVRNQFTGTITPGQTAFGGTVGVAPVGEIGTCFGLESKGNRSNKILYFSPSFDGLTFGVSFTPQGASRFAGGGITYGTDVQAPVGGVPGAGANILAVAADYVHDFGGWYLTVGGGGEWAFTDYTAAGGANPNKPSWYQAGAQIGIGHWSFGASGAYYVNYIEAGFAGTTAAPSSDGWVTTAGVNYSLGDVAVGLQGMYSQWGQAAGAGDEKVWGLSLNSTYAYGPGINLEAQFAYTAANYNGAAAAPFLTGLPPVHAIEVDLGTAINF